MTFTFNAKGTELFLMNRKRFRTDSPLKSLPGYRPGVSLSLVGALSLCALLPTDDSPGYKFLRNGPQIYK
jgi:hypothetical protein